MPSWKRVIVSGSDASLNSLTVSNGITGSLLGTASFANRATSASYALNGGVTQLLAGPNITLSPISGLGQVTVSSTGTGGPFFNTATGSYGSFYDTTTQTNVAGTARSMSFNTTDITNGVSISGSTNPFNTYIKTENAGVYDIQFSAQVDKTDSGTDEIWIWLRKNGTNLTDTATSVQLVGNGAHYVAAWNFFVNSAANDYYQLMWYSPDANVRLHAESGFGVVPGIPSVILTVNRVDQFLSNTGSFSGSFIGEFTGSLFGTSSWAQNALTASYITPIGTNAFVQGGNSFGTQALLGTNDNNNLAFETSGSVRMFISSSGNVGIGTSTPTSRLQVILPTDTINNIFRSEVGNNLLALQTFPTTDRMQLLLGDYNGTSTPNIAAISDSNTGIQWSGADILRFVNNGSENVTIDASGNVGIGTTTPASRLQVRGSGATSSTTALRIENSNASASMVVLDNGNVGIGTASPTYPLDVNGSSQFSVPNSIWVINPNVTYTSIGGTSQAANGAFILNPQSDFSQTYGGTTIPAGTTIGAFNDGAFFNLGSFRSAGGGVRYYSSLNGDSHSHTWYHNKTTQLMSLSHRGNLEIGNSTVDVNLARLYVKGSGATSSTTALRIENSNASASMVVLDDGNVGIGTTTPFRTLDVVGGALFGSTQGAVEIGNSGHLGYISGHNGIAFSTNHLNVGLASGEKVRITEPGNMGIGMSNPSAKLQVRGVGDTSSTTALRVENSGTTPSMVVLDNGNVGIGVTSPSYKFLVQDASTGAPATVAAFRNSSVNSDALAINVSSGLVRFISTWESSGIDMDMAFTPTTLAGTQTEVMRIKASNGFVGIGKTSPTAKLDISGSAIITGSLTVTGGITGSLFGTSSWAQNALTASFVNTLNQDLTFNGNLTLNGTASIGTLVVNQTVLSTGSNQLGDASNDTQTLFGSVIIPTGSFTVTGSLNANNTLFVSGSNVGIGTSTPTKTLDIVGEIRSSGRAFFNEYVNTELIYGNTDLVLAHSGGTTGIRIASSGIGIGGDTVSRRLTIANPNGTVNNQIALLNPSDQIMSTIANNTTTDDLLIANTQNIRFYAGSTIGNVITLPTNERLAILTNGNVGIGTSTPSAQLQVRGSGATSSTTALRIENSNASSSLVVLDDGFVGIGTANPAKALHILTNGTAQLRLQHTGYNYWDIESSFASNNVDLNFSMAGSSKVVFAAGGNVGIGTTSPTFRLQVDTSGSANSAIPLALTSVDTNNRVGILFGSSSLASGRQHKLFHRVNGSSVEWLVDTQANSSATWAFQPTDDSTYAVGIVAPFNVGDTARVFAGSIHSSLTLGAGGANNHLTISSGSGFVGIGTTTPTSRLDVYGNIRSFGDGNHTYFRLFSGASNRDSKILFGNDAERFNVGLGASTNTFSINSSNGGTPTSINVDYTSGNVGIGTTSVSSKLQVRGAGATSSTTALRIENSNASSSLVVLDNGSVGIRTATPGAALEVNGDTIFQSTGTGDGTLATTIKNSVGTQVLAIGAAGGIIMNASTKIKTTLGDSSITPYIELYSNSTGNTTIQSSTSYGLVLNPAGANVGIGTITPTQKLDINGALVVGMTTPAPFWNAKFKDYNDGSGIYISAINGGGGKYIAGNSYYYNSTQWWSDKTVASAINLDNGTLVFYTDSGLTPNTDYIPSERMRISSAGNLLVGTTSNLARLHVRGSGATSSTTTLRVENSSATPSMVVLDDGFVGINSTSVYQDSNDKLVITGGRLSINASSYNATFFNRSDSGLISEFGTGGFGRGGLSFDGTDFTLYSRSGLKIQHSTNSTAVTINTSGSVGIGTTTPTSRLQSNNLSTYNNSIPNGAIIASNLAGGNAIIDIGVDSTSLGYIQSRHIANTTVYNLLLNPMGGNVGIGTINPASRLDVQGDINIGVSGATTVSTYYNSTTRNQIIYTNNSSFEFIEGANERMRLVAGSGNLLVGTTSNLARLQVRGSGATSSTTALRIENSNASSSLVVLDNGNVGIGTTSPLSKLNIASDSNLVFTLSNIDNAIAGSSGSPLSRTISFLGYNDNQNAFIRSDDMAASFVHSNLIFGVKQSGTSATEFMRIDGQFGNVGIGTTSPNAKLHISGTLLVDNSLLINKTSSSLASGTRTLDSALTGSYSSAFYNYTISSGSNARAGQFMVVWNGGSVQYTDVSTLDIGNTSAIALTASLSGANLNVTAILPSDLWTIKTLANFL